MRLRVERWGDSLAVRLPIQYCRATGLSEGDELEVTVTSAELTTIGSDKPFDPSAIVTELAELHATLPMTEPVVELMRRESL